MAVSGGGDLRRQFLGTFCYVSFSYNYLERDRARSPATDMAPGGLTGSASSEQHGTLHANGSISTGPMLPKITPVIVLTILNST